MLRQTTPDILQQAIDSAPKSDSGAIDLTKAARIAEGGTHVLYRFTDSPFVIKLMKQNPNPAELAELERKYAILYDCFDRDGKQRCIREQHTTHQVLLPDMEPKDAALSFVPYEKCFRARVKFDFKMEPAELDPYLVEMHPELFLRANQSLITKDVPAADFNPDDYSKIDERIGAILQRLDCDGRLREVMIEFLTHYRDFYQKTNIILDAMGFENILFFKDATGDWQFKIGSAIKHDTGNYTNELFATMQAGKTVILDNHFVNFTHAYFSPANIRALNVCALKLGLKPVITDVTIDTKELIQITKELSTPQRMLAYAKHGDFAGMKIILQEHKEQICFDIGSYWAYSQIADEYIKHAQPLTELKNYLSIVSELRIELPENNGDTRRVVDDAKKIKDAKECIIGRKNIIDKKQALHHELTSTTAKLMDKGVAKKSKFTMNMPAEGLKYDNSAVQCKNEDLSQPCTSSDSLTTESKAGYRIV